MKTRPLPPSAFAYLCYPRVLGDHSPPETYTGNQCRGRRCRDPPGLHQLTARAAQHPECVALWICRKRGGREAVEEAVPSGEKPSFGLEQVTTRGAAIFQRDAPAATIESRVYWGFSGLEQRLIRCSVHGKRPGLASGPRPASSCGALGQPRYPDPPGPPWALTCSVWKVTAQTSRVRARGIAALIFLPILFPPLMSPLGPPSS